ncbi:uncharacterized protein LOC129595519 [Paramacrobiotus metropolitanus]|uniref:uncharacterized protein LOC129595519 n=1 Tax=Paramacrobiotus metropolitanus TaxID=2943436 RepID=UPI002445BEC6|nr:uncharacterized protein LOC129595519 [Paramacrobiotus metropolitanus]
MIFALLLYLFSSAVLTGIGALTYQDYRVDICNEVVELDCPTTASGSAGRITFRPHIAISATPDNFYNIPGYTEHCEQSGPCKLTVMTNGNCGSLDEGHAVYFNARSLNIPEGSRLDIYDRTDHGGPKLRRSWDAYRAGWYRNLQSVAQFRSQFTYRERPTIFIEYHHGAAACRESREIVLDFVMVEEKRTVNNTYCTALNGYVNNAYICDTTDDRVNCPQILSDMTRNMQPAWKRQFCWPSFWVMSGIIIAAVAVVALLVAMVALCRRRCRKYSCR